MKNLADSNKEFAIVIISANKLVIWLKFRTSKVKNPQYLLKDGRICSIFPLILPEF